MNKEEQRRRKRLIKERMGDMDGESITMNPKVSKEVQRELDKINELFPINKPKELEKS